MGRSTMRFIKVTLSLAICLILCLTSRTSAKHLLIETVNKASQDDGAKDYHFIGDGHHHEKDYHFVGDGHHHEDYLTRDYESEHKAQDYITYPPNTTPTDKRRYGRVGRK